MESVAEDDVVKGGSDSRTLSVCETTNKEGPLADKEEETLRKEAAFTSADMEITGMEEGEKEGVQCTPPPTSSLPVSAASSVSGICRITSLSPSSLHHLCSSPPTTGEKLSSPLDFLLEAHRHLGQMGWCCKQGGVFLTHSVQALRKELAILTKLPAKQREVREGGR